MVVPQKERIAVLQEYNNRSAPNISGSPLIGNPVGVEGNYIGRVLVKPGNVPSDEL
jgi:hypothetical protein